MPASGNLEEQAKAREKINQEMSDADRVSCYERMGLMGEFTKPHKRGQWAWGLNDELKKIEAQI
jgi:hypothetical protein